MTPFLIVNGEGIGCGLHSLLALPRLDLVETADTPA
jgi:hypothetical protein